MPKLYIGDDIEPILVINETESPAVTTITVFEQDASESGLLDAEGRPLVRKRRGIGFTAVFED